MTRCLFLIATALLASSSVATAEQDLCKLSFEKKNYEVARTVCTEMAKENPYAQYVLGEMSLDSSGRPTPAAIKWFLRAAENHVVDAQRRLGEFSHSGMLGSKNYKEARFWYEKAAQQSDPQSQANLGMMLVNGRGGDKDDVRGLMWLQLAANQGHAKAGEIAGKIKKKMPAAQVKSVNNLVADWESKANKHQHSGRVQ